MTNLKYNKTLSITIGDEDIKYGVLFGNEKIVFIKVGADGNIRGYQNKYLKMAHRVHDRIGATVICASNPYIIENTHIKADKSLIEKVIADRGPDNYELYFVGNSDGGDHSLKLSQQFPKTVKFLGINSSYVAVDDFVERILSLSFVKKIFVYGTHDVDFDRIVPKLKTLECDSLEIVLLDGADHDFSGKVDDFIALIDLI